MKSTFALTAMIGSAFAGYAQNDYPVYPTTTEVEVTYTTVCPTTETVSYPGSTIVTTYTTTSVCITTIPTTIYETVHGPDVTKTAQDVAYSTMTSLCPVTETQTVEGNTVVVTWTSTSTILQPIQTTDYVSVHGPDVTKTTQDIAYTTTTSLCPVTETKTVEGNTVIVTWTSTSTIVQPVTATNYVSYTVTEHTSTEVYETCPVTIYTTVSKGETICITETGTETYYTTHEYVVTETIPITLTEEVDVTVTSAAYHGQTVTIHPSVYVTKNNTQVVTHYPAPSTVAYQYPTTIATSAYAVGTTYTPKPTTSSSVYQVAPNMGVQPTPAAALLMGIFGLAAFL